MLGRCILELFELIAPLHLHRMCSYLSVNEYIDTKAISLFPGDENVPSTCLALWFLGWRANRAPNKSGSSVMANQQQAGINAGGFDQGRCREEARRLSAAFATACRALAIAPSLTGFAAT